MDRSRNAHGTGRRTRSIVTSFAVLVATLAGAAAMATPAAASDLYDPAADVNSLYNTTRYTGVQDWWRAGYTGTGVDVAVIDTGVTPVDALAAPGKIVYGPDLSLDSQDDNLRNLDANGHGTFMAGIIAGNDGTASGSYADNPSSFLGVAPDARIVSLKVGTADGSVDVSQVIAAVDWVVQHRKDNGLNIRVLNLSYGTDSTQSYLVDPLAFAVEQARKAGILVVVASGNEGYVADNGTLADPAYDPKLFAVGASDSRGTLGADDDRVASYSSTGNASRSVDIVAPGSHIVGPRVPGSFVDLVRGDAGDVDASLMRGSGTSEAAAFVSGAAALVLQQRPSISPLQLKRLFMDNADSLSGFTSIQQGKGLIDMRSMLSARTPWAWGSAPWSSGGGSLELSRGSQHLVDEDVMLEGEFDIFGEPFDAVAMASAEAARTAWNGGEWNGSVWSGSDWSGSDWADAVWSGHTWSGHTWSGHTWSGNTWSGHTWSGDSWSGHTWSGHTWSGNTWSSKFWTGDAWLGATWR
jgi:hypothetical protein